MARRMTVRAARKVRAATGLERKISRLRSRTSGVSGLMQSETMTSVVKKRTARKVGRSGARAALVANSSPKKPMESTVCRRGWIRTPLEGSTPGRRSWRKVSSRSAPI
jgi:hypothetical protein